MRDLCLHLKTNQDISRLVSSKPHAILVIGPSGSGKKSLNKVIAEKLLDTKTLEDYPYALTIRPEGKSIGIENVRQMEHFLALKVPSDHEPNRVVIIEDAEKLSLEGQNALLKTLEEPPKDTVIIMSLSDINQILPTVRSRTQKLYITPPEEASLREYYSGTEASDFNQAFLISGGLPGLLNSLLSNEDHDLKAATIEARDILSKKLYERSLMINNLAKDAGKLMNILQIMEQMALVSLKRGASPERWQKVLEASYNARNDLAANAQTKLTLLKLMLSL